MKLSKKLLAATALAIGMNAASPGDAHATVHAVEGGPMAIHDKTSISTKVVAAAIILIGQMQSDMFNQLWGTTGTIKKATINGVEFRVDIQRPMQDRQNIQIQHKGATVATVIIKNGFANISSIPSVAAQQVSEFMSRFRAALVISANSVLAWAQYAGRVKAEKIQKPKYPVTYASNVVGEFSN